VPRHRPATLQGWSRCCKKGAEQIAGVCSTHRGLVAASYPAVMQTCQSEHSVEGIILERLRPQEIRCLDFYEDDSYQKVPCTVTAESGFGGHEPVEALVYAWPTNATAAAALDGSRPWQYTHFRQHHMQSFIESVVKPCRARFEKDEGELEVIMTDRSERGVPLSHRGAAPPRP
jgi:hypothetical protein